MAGRGEFDLIAELFAPLASDPAALGLTDDGAVLSAGTDELVVVKDALVEGVHFLPDDPPATVAQKALRVNLSDLAAMGARATHYLMALVRPARLDDAWLEAMVAGLRADQAAYGVSLLGGDTVSTPGPLVLSVTALGRVPAGAALTRAGAGPGEDVWVSGTLGDAALGLVVLRGGWSPPEDDARALVNRYRLPQPRLALGAALRGVATACQDVSDGLVQDLGHIAARSGLAVTLEADAVPLSEAARDAPEALVAALTGGDDYELVFTAAPERRPQVHDLACRLGLALTRIGRTAAGGGVVVRDRRGAPVGLDRRGWSHGWN
ncbi:MAG: thiamine-phosphate kinase [Alphaproteobacteria bacterium]